MKKFPSFGAFIMTYERPEILGKTISILREQSFPPALILVVDNSFTSATFELVETIKSDDLEYIRMDYNKGPAGAAKKGLETLFERGFEWIYWGDDDDPPKDNCIFEKFFEGIEVSRNSFKKIGIFGGRGGRINKFTGRVRSLKNSELLERRIQEVDMIPGGHTMLINREVIRKGILPLEKLFFGFEDLDFCLKTKKNGFANLVHSEIWLQENYKEGYKKNEYRWRGSSFGDKKLLWREYYSTRNLLYILFSNKYFFAFSFVLIKTSLKSLAGFKFGLDYGKKNFSVQLKALQDFIKGRFGERNRSEFL